MRFPAAALGRVAAHITDTSKKPIQSARATLTGPVVVVAASDHSGDMVFHALPAGMYRLVIVRPGYHTVIVGGVALAKGQRLRLAVQLGRLPTHR